MLLLLTACTTRREVERKDWPTLSRDKGVSVRTLAGTWWKYDQFLFTTEGLAGRGQTNDFKERSAPIPLDSIAVVRVSRTNRPATLLLLAAAATAAFVVVAEAQSEVRPAPAPRPPPVSCPFIYSFDGTDYVFDSETYAGAIARGLERTDVDNLDFLRAVDGKYRLRLTNDRPETHYTDELALLVADHPRGSRAIPDGSGTVHVVRGAVSATRVTEFRGDTTPARAGWEVVFPRPRGDSAALVLRLRNTAVPPFVLHRMLSLLGSDVYKWYGSLHRDRFARGMVQNWIDNEGALAVIVSTGGDTWRAAGRLPDVGPAIAKDNVVVLDLRDVVGDSIRIRLESSPDLWLMERAELATYGGVAPLRELRPTRAIDERGVDVTSLLSAHDARYLVTATGSVVTLEFDAVRAASGEVHSILARTTGHYYVHTDDRAAPRAEIVARLFTDRKFLQDYVQTEWFRAGFTR
jgi:hypothetical protein